MKPITFQTNWRNFKRRATSTKDQKEQNQVNKQLIDYIQSLQEQITEIQKFVIDYIKRDDDGR